MDELQIPLPDILLATNNFDENNIIGRGGFGKVYQGKSEQYGTIAVKRSDRFSSPGEHEFRTEVSVLSAYKHENLVSLVGYCDQDGKRILVYKHESNGSLDKLLHSKRLNWTIRLGICLDIAHGLKYLHVDVGSEKRVLHGDVKSANILLNRNWAAKISDFGLSKIRSANDPFTFLTLEACGTIGYHDQEYFETGVFTQKSDIYSFGVVLFEILFGRPASDLEYLGESQSLSILAKSHYENGKLDEIIDSDLHKQMYPISLKRFSAIAYQCLSHRREDRPSMSQIVEQLEQALADQLVASSVNVLRSNAHTSFTVDDHQRLSTPKDVTNKTIQQSRLQNHDVFVSFRGTDIDKTFMDHLYSTLLQKGIYSYMTDETLHWDESITPSLCNKIKESKIVLIVFSKNYAKSWWLLNELTYIMENKDEIGQIVMPIFYDVDPLYIQKQQEEFENTYPKNDLNYKKVESWRRALKDAASIAGWALNDIMHGTEFIKVIVNKISHGLLPSMSMSMSSANARLIGISTRMRDLKSQLQVGVGGVSMVGIYGIGGIGKTTLAAAIYDEIHQEFEGCCFVKKVSTKSRMYGLKTLQEKILSKVLKQRKMVLESIEEGISMMKSSLNRTRVLIVLDDIDHLDHLTTLAASQDWFGEGSRIIVTTRNKDLLNAHNIDIIYDVKLLNEVEANELFSWHAFGARRPVEGYENLSIKMVSKCGGHPSTLVSLGSFLRSKDMNDWSRLENILDHEIVDLFKTDDNGLRSRNLNSWLGL